MGGIRLGPINLNPATTESPLGHIHFQAEICGQRLDDALAETYSLKSGTRLFVWSLATGTVELLLCDIHQGLPTQMEVLACHAAIWRLRALD